MNLHGPYLCIQNYKYSLNLYTNEYVCIHIDTYIALESQWPAIMGYFSSFMGYFGL